jgi:hypothetical protein
VEELLQLRTFVVIARTAVGSVSRDRLFASNLAALKLTGQRGRQRARAVPVEPAILPRSRVNTGSTRQPEHAPENAEQFRITMRIR